MEDVNTEVWKNRIEKDEFYRRELTSVFKDLRTQARGLSEYYKNSKAHNSDRFYSAFTVLCEHLQFGIESGVGKLLSVAHHYDFDPNLPSNGYRSFVKIIHKCCLHLVQLCRHISANRGSLLFRSGHYSRELVAYVTTLGQLRACIYYLDKLLSYCESGVLIPDEDKMTEAQFKESEVLMKEVESLNQECFYGRCLGFQYCESMQKPLMTVCLFMASFSDGYLSENSSTVMKVANSVLGGSRYMMDAELRGQKIVEVTRNCDINFCKAFWAMNENDVMHTLPLFVCPPVQLDKVILVPPETFELPTVGDGGSARITPPCAHTGPGPVSCRLISYELREGHETWKSRGVSAKQTDTTKILPRSSGLLIHLHGGGFVAQSSASHEVYLRHWAKELRVPIFCIDYSLAPNQPFPRAFEEVCFAYCWALKNVRALGSTGERICLCGDSAGGNLALAMAIRIASMNVRLPDGIQTTYGCQLVRYTPSPSRMMALMDPLLPLGILSRCLAAYAGMTEETGVNAPMGASITKQTLLEMDEENELKEQQLQREEELQKQAKEFQEQAERLQEQAKKLLEETHKLRMRTSSLNLDNLSGNFSNSSTNSSPVKSRDFSPPVISPPENVLTEPAEEDSFSVEDSKIIEESNVVETSDESKPQGTQSDLGIKYEENVCDKSGTDECKETQEVVQAEEKATTETPVSFTLDENTDEICDMEQINEALDSMAPDSQMKKDTDSIIKSETDTETNESVETDRNITKPVDEISPDVQKETGSKNTDSKISRQRSSGTDLDTVYEQTHSKDLKNTDVTEIRSKILGHKVTGSDDSGFHDYVKIPPKSNIDVYTNNALPNAKNISPCEDAIFALAEDKNEEFVLADNFHSKSTTETETATSKSRNRFNLDLKLNAKSPSSPNLLGHRLSSDLMSPDSPADFYTPVGSMHTPSYAKVRHIAQSPVDQLTHIPMSRNPYMSPYLAEAELLKALPPVYFVCCELDPMLDDSIQMAKRLRDLGNEVHVDVLADLPHGFLNFSLVSRDAKQGSEFCVRRIKQILETDDEGIFHMDDVAAAEDFEILEI